MRHKPWGLRAERRNKTTRPAANRLATFGQRPLRLEFLEDRRLLDAGLSFGHIIYRPRQEAASAPVDSMSAQIRMAGTAAGAAQAVSLTVAMSHSGNFKEGDVGDTYTITVSNVGVSSTTGTVSVVDTLPAGLTATAMTRLGLDREPLDPDGHAQRPAGRRRQLCSR